MELIIKVLKKHTQELEDSLYYQVINLNNSMNKCECKSTDRDIYDFKNTMSFKEDNIYCLNCGGHVEIDDI